MPNLKHYIPTFLERKMDHKTRHHLMKVLHFKTKYLNRSETFIDRLVRNHDRFQPVIATCESIAYTDDLDVYEMPSSRLSGYLNILQLKLNMTPAFLFDVVRKEKPGIIHGHFGLDSYRLIRLKETFDLPLVVQFYGHDVSRLPQKFGWKLRYKRLFKHMDRAIAITDDMKKSLIRLGFDEDQISIIKLSVDVENIAFKHRTEAGPKLMMVGRCVEKKGFIYALKALKTIVERRPSVSLDLYGDGELLPELKSFVRKHGLSESVNFHGFTANDKVFEALYEHDILLVPSVQAKDGDREGLPQTTVEGMATGIPVIASTHAGLPELVLDEETGLLVPTRDAEAISNAVHKLLDQPELASKISWNGRRMVEQEHNVKNQVKQTEDLYNRLIS